MAKRKSLYAKKTIHLNVELDLRPKLETYATERGLSITACINMALRDLLSVDSVNPTLKEALDTILSRRFNLPKNFTSLSFYNCLYLNAINYPKYSAKKYWTDVVYLSDIDKTHKLIYEEVQDELKREVKKLQANQTR